MKPKKPPDKLAFARNLRRLRGKRSQEALARELDVSSSIISRWERGVKEPSLATLRRLAEQLGSTPAEMLE